MAYDRELADRIRDWLAPRQSVREVTMFGGLGFMINDKLTVFAHGGGGLWLRCAPSRVDELERKGAQAADMGNGRSMGVGWLQVSGDCLSTEETLGFWLDTALEHNHRAAPPKRKR